MTRISTSARIKVQNRAEVEIMRYAHDHALWHRHVHGVELDPCQVLKCVTMDQHPNTIDVSCRRTGKTTIKELYLLKHLATNPRNEEGIVSPRLQQSQVGLGYHLEAIQRSEILSAYIAVKSGRRQCKDTGYQFANGSKAIALGIMSQIDGDSLTCASIDEVDDQPHDRLMSRFLPMLGAARRMGASSAEKFEPQIRVTGVFKGSDVLTGLIETGRYKLLPTVDVYLGQAMGILTESWVEEMRAQQTSGEWIRQFLCQNVASQNWIFEKFIRRAMAVGLSASLVPAGPLPGQRYRRRGLVSFGLDWSGHGESATASRSALVVCEQVGNFVTFPFVKAWPAGTDDKVVETDLFGLWQYFRPDYAIGDAFGLGALTSLNDRLYAHGLTDIDRRSIGDGASTASTWAGWAFAPLRFEGMTKHSMASVLRAAFHNGQACIPVFDEDAADCADWRDFVRHLGNVKAEQNKAGYASFKKADPKIGDDFFDAACAGVWALTTRGAEFVPTVIEHRTATRAQLLGEAA